MIGCPYCHSEIEDSSKFCDQCGKELMYCPSCKEPRVGTECPKCGEDLISAKVFFLTNPVNARPNQPQTHNNSSNMSNTSPSKRKEEDDVPQGTINQNRPTSSNTIQQQSPSIDYNRGQSQEEQHQGTVAAPESPNAPSLSLVGNGWCLPLKSGSFGRKEGIYPEFSSVGFISGTHGQIKISGRQWQIQDSGSTNGTFINGVRLEPGKWYSIKKGDTLKIATIIFQVD